MRALLPALSTGAETPWLLAIAVAAAAHVAAISVVLVSRGEAAAPLPEPVMVVELPAAAAPAAAPIAAPVGPVEPNPPLPAMLVPRLVAPPVDAPVPRERIALPTPPPVSRQPAPPAPLSGAVVAQAAAPAGATRPAPVAPAAGTSPAGGGPGTNAAAQAAEADWYSLISAHLERSKRYPREAKQAAQQGTPVVRFAVDRRGRVSDVSIARSSGHDLLDRATLELLRRVAPLPAMPRAMGRDSVVISLPIEYSLSRK